MVAQGSGFGRALSGWIRSAGKSSVREIAILSRFPGHVGWFQEGIRASSAVECVAKAGEMDCRPGSKRGFFREPNVSFQRIRGTSDGTDWD